MRGTKRLTRSGVLLTILTIVASLLILSPAGAVPCGSGYPFDLRSELRSADAAIVGEVVSEVEIDPSYPSLHAITIRVTEVLKGEVDEEIVIETRSYPCPFFPPQDRPFGARLNQDEDGDWHASSGDILDPDVLREAASPFPPPGDGEPAFLLAGGFGEVGLLALDADGRTVGYGYGDSGGLAMCPGSKYMAEVNSDGVSVLRISFLTSSRPLGMPEPSGGIYDIECIGRHGRVVVAYFVTYSHGDKRFRIVRRHGHIWETLLESRARPLEVGAETALLARPRSVYEFTYSTGTQRRIYEGPGRITEVKTDPSGSRTAILEQLSYNKFKVSLEKDGRIVGDRTFGGCSYPGVGWADGDRLIVSRCESAFLLDLRLNTLDRMWRTRGSLPFFVHGIPYFRDFNFLFRRDGDRWEKIRTFFSTYVYDIEPLAPGTEIDAPPYP